MIARLLAGLLVCGAALAAQDPGVLYGTVRDSAGRPLAGAPVMVAGSELRASTDAGGAYRLAGVPPGRVVVRAGAIGYGPARRELDVGAGDSVEVNFVLIATHFETTLDYHALPAIVVTAAKRSQLLDQAVTSVAVVGAEQLAQRAVNGVDEAIDRAPGVQFLNGQINIRGSSGYVLGLGSRVLLLVDGVPMNQGDRGGINWDIVPVDQVERVEIVKGAGSALYGSAAFGGVVNLITREVPDGLHARVRATAGLYADPPHDAWQFRDTRGGQGGGDVTASYGHGRFRGAFAGGARRSDGYREQDARDHWQLAGRSQWVFSPATRVRVSGAWAEDDYQVPLAWCTSGFCDDQGEAYQPFKIDEGARGAHTTSAKGYLTAALTSARSERERWEARASWLRTRFQDDRPPRAPDYSMANRFGGEVRGEIRATPERVVTVGAEMAWADVNANLFGAHTQAEFAAYGESEQRHGPVRFTTGLRVDYLTVDGGGLRAVVSPRAGVVWSAPHGTWRASAGHGFRAPSIAERFVRTTALGFEVVPNPSLDPETAWSLELGHARTIATRLRLDAAVFWTEARALIEPTLVVKPGAPGEPDTMVIQFRNVSRARLVGLDLTATAAPHPRVAATLAYQYLRARQLASTEAPEQPLAFRPTHLASLSADLDLPPWMSLGADVRYMSRFQRVEIYTDDPRVAATVLDVRMRYRRGPLTVALLAANALNYVYNLAPRTLAPVRTLTATVTWIY